MHDRTPMNAVPTTEVGGTYAGRLQGVGSAPEAPLTLTRALTTSEHLTERLLALRDSVADLATKIGGPWPAPATQKAGNSPPSSVVAVVNRLVDGQHELVSEIDQAMNAIRRSLGD